VNQRYDLYGPIHKAIRLSSSRVLTSLGQLDVRDPREVAEVLGSLRAHLLLADEHLEHEDRVLSAPIAEAAPALAASLGLEHGDHRAAFEEMEALARTVETAADADRYAAARQLYLRFSTYFADDLEHMAREEQAVTSALHARFTDAELMAFEHEIVSQIPAERQPVYHALMIPGMNPSERAGFLRGIQAGAPAEVYEMVSAVARQVLTPGQFRVLSDELAYVV